MNINGDVHFDGWPRADVKDFPGSDGFCVLRLVDIDHEQHQLFLKPEHLGRARLTAAAINGDLDALRSLLDVAEADARKRDCASRLRRE